MPSDKQFSTLKNLPATVIGGMHPDTKKIIEKIEVTKGKVLAVKLQNPHAAKIRLDAIRRARKKNRVKYKAAYRKKETLYFKLR